MIQFEYPTQKTLPQVRWNPKKNISAYELALCMPLLLNTKIPLYEVHEKLMQLPETAQRHFEIIK